MTAPAPGPPAPRNAWLTVAAWRRLFRDRPLIPLIGLLVALVVALQLVQPGIVTADWVGATLRAAVPLAILAGCQTLAMLTGGIDLSVGAVASMAAFVMATLVNEPGPARRDHHRVCRGDGRRPDHRHRHRRVQGPPADHDPRDEPGRPRPRGGLPARDGPAGVVIPDAIQWLGSGTTLDFIPNSLFLFVPLSILIIVGLRRSGYGRLLFAVGDNAVAARLSGVRVWQVHLVLYTISALLAAVAGLLIAGLNKTASPALVESAVLPSVAAAVIGGTSILGGRGGFGGTIVGALILTLLTALLTVLQMPEGVRQILFGAIIVVVAAAYTRVTSET